MPGQLAPLHLLHAAGAFSRTLPNRFSYLSISARAPAGSRRLFFTRSAAASPGGSSDRSVSAAARSKSLIEDEAELSDWVSDLRFPENDRDEIDRRTSSDSGRDSMRNSKLDSRNRFGSRQSENGDRGGDFYGKKRREGSDGNFSPKRWRQDVRKASQFGMKNRLEDVREDKDDDDEEEEEEIFSSRKSKGALARKTRQVFGRNFGQGRGSSSPEMLDNSEDDDEDDEDDEIFSSRKGSSALGRRNRKDMGRSYEQVNGSRRQSLAEISDEDDEDDEEENIFSRNSNGAFTTRKKKDNQRNYRQEKRSKGSKVAELSDEDDGEMSGFEDDFFGDKVERKEGAAKTVPKEDTYTVSNGENVQQPVLRSFSGQSDTYLSQTRFDQCSISPLSLKGIKSAGYKRMTIVQEATLPVILKGKDVLAKAKTGTGKTVAFLLPAIEVVAKLPPVDRDQKRPPINVLVICPTRELATQAATEAETLLKYHPSIGVQVVIGGTRLALEQKRMQTNPCQILVATPGRLRDHLENTPGFATRLMGVKVLVLDEADRLLDMGFRKDIEKIIAAVPKQRQTLLFSATVPDEVRQICYIAMKRDHEFVNTVEEGSEETHSQVRQMHIVEPLEKHFSILYGLLRDHIAEDVDYKVIVFCTTAMMTKLVADLLAELHLNVREIHSRKPQTYRTRVSKEFKESKGLILVSSDVSARGVDYPDVTLVIQIGVPADREQYIHRLGRTGRKGKEGQGILLLAPWEEFFLSSVKDLPMTKASIPLIDPETRKKVERALAHVELKNKESAYQAWLGYYNSNKNIGRDKFKLVALANDFSRSMGLDNPPAIPQLVLRKMGLQNVPGLRSK